MALSAPELWQFGLPNFLQVVTYSSAVSACEKQLARIETFEPSPFRLGDLFRCPMFQTVLSRFSSWFPMFQLVLSWVFPVRFRVLQCWNLQFVQWCSVVQLLVPVSRRPRKLKREPFSIGPGFFSHDTVIAPPPEKVQLKKVCF